MATATATTTTSAIHGFSLFPTTVPKIAIPNPHKRNPSLHRISMVASPDDTLSPAGESVVFKMEEERPPLPQLPTHFNEQHRTRESTPSPDDIGRAVTTHSPIDGRTPTQATSPSTAAAKYTPSLYQSPGMSQSSPQPSSSLGTGSATTLVAQPAPTASTPINRNKSPVDPSPIVPIRSMFPVYDPSVPLTQQAYAPPRPLPARLSGMPPFAAPAREEYRSSLSMPFTAAAAPRTAPASVLNFPSDVMSVNVGPRVSTQRELEKLWDVSHGTEPGCSIRSFELEMARTEEATFVFGSHPSLPFYTLQTYDTNEIAVSKTCPKRVPPSATSPSSAEPPLTRDVVLCPLEPAERRQPPNDGLVAFVFPKLAAMLAINQSAALAKQHNLAPTDRDDIEAQAVRRAAKQEACSLRYNARGGFYELEHPAIGRGAMGGDFATKSPIPSSPTTIRSITGKPVLHIIISKDSPLPSIHVVDPNASRRAAASIMTPTTANPSSAGPGIRRFSTIPQTETSPSLEFPPLATLDLTSEILHIDANSILELMPSLFSIDCVVSAIMAVAVADATTNPALGSMEVWKPRPAPPSRYGGPATGARSIFNGAGAPGSVRPVGTRPGSVKSYAGSAFYATIAEREEAEEEAKLMRKTHREDVRAARSSSKAKSKSKPSRTWFGRSTSEETDSSSDIEQGSSRRKNKKNKNKKIVMREFDLEKLGHYQSGDRKGEELPAVTRGAIGGLVMGLKLVVWFLTLVVQVITWLLVHITRGVTSEKF
ncbi:hypothetical protein G647_02815 [Cladophialophora carrionii CBS 160.54]|uniref:Uncharacterized protein n=1 Tax=Cladophialophora carrionii CBS 160.54 TaxID=1279043 RepID=V9DI95_9EURO|nr:uncharacterized protein G647_02815 [Cladophialophora carrionii CBS 160.54]ETI26038.1 hypothetical protein G647_02815 [Cladophialophora carrionii CBS 160.54]